MATYDVIVVGLGGMGSAAAAHLAARGQRVLGLERFGPAHDRGSSHGGSRIIRQSYFEDPAYVPLLLRAYELWDQLADDTGADVITLTGGLFLGRPDSLTVAGSLRAAREWDLPHEMLDAGEIRRRFPTLTPADDEVGLYEAAAGFVRPEVTVAAHLAPGRAAGAELHFDEPVTGWSATAGGGVRVRTTAAEYTAGQLVICPGAWAPELLADLGRAVHRRAAGHVLVPARRRRRRRSPGPAPDLHPRGRRRDRSTASRRSTGRTAAPRWRSSATAARARPDTIDREVHPAEVSVMAEHLRCGAAHAARPVPHRGDLHVHHHARPALRDRAAPAARRRDGGLRLLRARLQVRAGGRRDPRRPRHHGDDEAPDRAVRPAPAGSGDHP